MLRNFNLNTGFPIANLELFCKGFASLSCSCYIYPLKYLMIWVYFESSKADQPPSPTPLKKSERDCP